MTQQYQWQSTESFTDAATSAVLTGEEMEREAQNATLFMTSLRRTSLEFSTSDPCNDDDDDDLMLADPAESRHMRMPQRSSFIDTSRAFMTRQSCLE